MNKTMVTILVMHDNEKSHSIRVRNFIYKTFCSIIILLPILLSLTLYACYYLWNDNKILSSSALHIQNETNKAKALAENLAIFSILLNGSHPINANIVQMNQTDELAQNNIQNETIETLTEQVGPGHLDFPVVDTKEIIVENINARILDDGKISISLDLRNPDPKKTITGHVDCSLVDATGVTHTMKITPELKGFKINRFKRVVFMPNITPNMTDENINVIIEVFNKEGKIMYRNLTPVEQSY